MMTYAQWVAGRKTLYEKRLVASVEVSPDTIWYTACGVGAQAERERCARVAEEHEATAVAELLRKGQQKVTLAPEECDIRDVVKGERDRCKLLAREIVLKCSSHVPDEVYQDIYRTFLNLASGGEPE